MRPMLLCLLICTVFIACKPRAILMRPILLRANGCTYSTSRISSDTIPLVLITFALMLANCSFCCNHLKVRYVSFDTDLSTLRKFPIGRKLETHFYPIFVVFVMSDSPHSINIALIIHLLQDIYPTASKIFCQRTKILYQSIGLRKCISHTGQFLWCWQLLASAISPETHFLCLFVTFTTCTTITKTVPLWVTLLLILLSNDIEMNPGPFYHVMITFSLP